jgi:hypothetical protein
MPALPTRLLACAALAAAGLATAQVPPGQLVAAPEPGGPALILVDPLSGTVSPIQDPSGLLPGPVSALALADRSGAVLAGIRSPGGSQFVALVVVQGAAIAAVRPWTADLGEPPIALRIAPDGRLAVATPTRMLALPFGGGPPTALARAPAGQTFVGLAAFGPTLVGLASAAQASTLVLVDTATGATVARPLALTRATALAEDPGLGGLLLGDAAGGLHLVETGRFVLRPLARLTTPILALTRDGDRGEVFAATPVGIQRVASGLPGRLLPGPGLVALAYREHASDFSTYGQGCGPPGQEPRIAATGRPFPGSLDFVVRLGGGPPSSPALLLLGLAPGAVPLDALGLAGCTLLVAPLDALAHQTSPSGTAGLRLRIPPDPNLVGQRLYLQWAMPTRPLGLWLSNAGRATP